MRRECLNDRELLSGSAPQTDASGIRGTSTVSIGRESDIVRENSIHNARAQRTARLGRQFVGDMKE